MNTLNKFRFVLDSHCDTPSMLLEGVDLSERGERTHVDYPRMKEGGVDGSFFAIYTPASLTGDAATVHALNLLSLCYDSIDSNRGCVGLATTPAQALRNKESGKLSIFLGMENGTPIQKNLSYLRFFHKMGVRYLTLCHSRHNEICDSCTPKGALWGGLSSFGKEVVGELNRLGMMIDVSHASDATFYDLLKYSKAPIVATHSSCRALCHHPRNMSDSMIRDLADSGGVIQINFYPRFIESGYGSEEYERLSEEGDKWQQLYRGDTNNKVYRDHYFRSMHELSLLPTPSYKRVVDHIDHAVSLAGPEHVGLGSDFDGIEVTPQGLGDISSYGIIASELENRGYSPSHIDGIMGGNFLRVMKEIQKESSLSDN